MMKIRKVLQSLMVVGMLILGTAGVGAALSFTINVPNEIEPGTTVDGNITLYNVTNNQFYLYDLEICNESDMVLVITDYWKLGTMFNHNRINIISSGTDSGYVAVPEGKWVCNFTISIPLTPSQPSYSLKLREDKISDTQVPLLVKVKNTSGYEGYSNRAGWELAHYERFAPDLPTTTIWVKSAQTFSNLTFNPDNGDQSFNGSINTGSSKVNWNASSLAPTKAGVIFDAWYADGYSNARLIDSEGNLISSSNTTAWVQNGKWTHAGDLVTLTARYTTTAPSLDLTGTNLSGHLVTEPVKPEADGSYIVTLKENIGDIVSIPDNWGNVTLNLNGKTIKPTVAGANGLLFTSNSGSGTNLTVANGEIYGANGAAPGGNGGAGIGGTGTGLSLIIASNAKISGGAGANGADNDTVSGTNGGNGGAGIGASVSSLLVEGTVIGGNGGNGGSTTNASANGGNGGVGGTGSIVNPTNITNGLVAGGDGGNGGNAVNGTAGTGGNAGNTVNGAANIAGSSHLYDGIPGAGGKVTGSGQGGNNGNAPTQPSVTPVGAAVIEVISEKPGEANKSLGIVSTNLTRALTTQSSTDAYQIEMHVVGEINTTSANSSLLYQFVKKIYSRADVIDMVDITVTEENLSQSGSKHLLNKTGNVIEIFVPYSTSGKDIKVFRHHEGQNKSFDSGSRGSYIDGTFCVTGDGIYLYSQLFSDFVIASAPSQSPSPSPTQSRTYVDTKQQGISQILPSNAYAEYTPQPTTTPTPSGTSLPIPTSPGSKYPYIPTSSPAPVAGVLLGLLGGAAVVFGLRRKQQ